MLMEECVRAMQQTLRASPSIKKRAKSVYSQRNLGTIKNRKKEKKEEKEAGGGETIMRILRMRYVSVYVSNSVLTLKPPGPSRPNTSDFIAQQLQILATMQAEQEQRERQQQKRKAHRPGGTVRIPDVPAVPEIPPP